jgi:cell division protein FtsI/penicillin-binding protein 2
MGNNNDSIRTRMTVMILVMAAVPFLLAWRFFHIQVVDHDYYLKKARNTYTTKKQTTGKRGEIFDCHGNLLAGNAPCVHITADPSHYKTDATRKKMAYILARHLPGTMAEYIYALRPVRQRRGKDGKLLYNPDGTPNTYEARYAMLERNVPLETAEKIRHAVKVNKLPKLFLTEDYMRVYPKGSMLSNVLGYTNVVNDKAVPQGGLEKKLHDAMIAETGKEVFERTRGGAPLAYGLHETQACKDGKNIYLTISEPIQAILEEALDEAYAKWTPKTIYAALVDPKTGNIMAMAQRPTFNPNDRSTFRPEAARTRIAEDMLEPGSIMKPFSIGKALDWKLVTPDTMIDCENGRWMYMGRPLTDSHAYDKLSVAQVIQKSSNIGTAKVALFLGKERVYEALRMFGFGEKTGLPFAIEGPGKVSPPQRWDGLTITRMPIGYSVQVTPLQMLRAYCALANNGLLPELRLIDRIVDPATGQEERFAIAKPKQMFEHPDAHRQLVDMMALVTQKGGTARKAAIPGYEVAGKTGTSRKYVPGVGYSAGKYFASFVGFVPARDPAFVMLVTVDEPKGASYGGTVAGPTFTQVASKVLKHLNIHPDPILLDREK